jgi:mannitol 2-dehydrogenase
MSIALNEQNLDLLPGNIARPAYDRALLTGGIVHVGIGNFHRAHMAVYLDQLFARGKSHEWAIIGAGVRDADNAMRDRLQPQDWLYTVTDLDPGALRVRVVGSMVDFLPIDPQAILTALTNPAVRIVTLTVTEGGYYIDAATGGLAANHPDIVADAAAPQAPKTIFGLVIRALRLRNEAGIAPFTVLSCDNLPGNGHLTRETVTGLAQLSDEGFAEWIGATVAFPNAMVDCITPATSDRERALIEERFGIADHAPVICEPFRQWVIEDHFPSGRPALEEVGVEFVEDVTGYELMKLRILNGGHASIAYASGLLGHHYVHEAMADPDITAWLRAVQLHEAIPTLRPLKGVDYRVYLETVIKRFGNTEIADTIPRLALDGSDRQPKFILPTLRDALAAGGAIDGLALELALWCRYCLGQAENGTTIELRDAQADELRKAAIAAQDRPSAFLENESVFGDLRGEPRLVAAFGKWLGLLRDQGVRETLKTYVAS